MKAATPIRVGPVTVRLISQGDRIAGSLKDRGPFEPATLETWALMCASANGGRVIDVGGYTGLFSVAGRLLGAHVLAFEPMPSNRLRFQENCRLNKVSDKVSSEAIADRCGEGELSYNSVPYTAGASLVKEWQAGHKWPVQLLTLDSLNLQKCCAIKIDVERAEPLVLRGARDLLQRCRPELLIEVLGDAEGDAVLEALDGLGYRHAVTLDVRNWLMVPE